MKSLAIISNQAFSLVNFRTPLVRALVQSGVQVYTLAPDFDSTTRARIREVGATPVDYSLSRTGLNPVRDAIDIMSLVKVLRHLNCDATFGYFVKPVIYGSIASWVAGVPRRYSMIAGLGYAFGIDEGSTTAPRRALRKLIGVLYRFALDKNSAVFLQNEVDREDLCSQGILDPGKVVMLAGTGVDLVEFRYVEPVISPVKFIMVARMLREKGVYEFIEAARQVRRQYPSARFTLVGGVDANPAAVHESDLRNWVSEGLIEWSGHVDDVRPWLRDSSVFVLPSFYREGKPRSTQEAMATGRAVVTTNAPGCCDTVIEGVNGYRVPTRDADALAQAMVVFIERPDLIISMGAASRRIAELQYDIHKINGQMLAVMKGAGGRGG